MWVTDKPNGEGETFFTLRFRRRCRPARLIPRPTPGTYRPGTPMIETVARRIVRAALAGERNVFKLTEIGAGGRDPEPGSFLQ